MIHKKYGFRPDYSFSFGDMGGKRVNRSKPRQDLQTRSIARWGDGEIVLKGRTQVSDTQRVDEFIFGQHNKRFQR